VSRTDGEPSRSVALIRGFAVLSLVLAVAVALLCRELAREGAQRTPTPVPTPAEQPARLDLAPATFADLPGWNDDTLDGFAVALARSCTVFARIEAAAGAGGDPRVAWRGVCGRVVRAETPRALRETLETELRPWSMRDRERDQGLVTGYYEPLLHGSLRRSDRFDVPLYMRPPELVDVDLGAFRDEYKGRRLAGVVRGNKLVPFSDRAGLEQGAIAGRGLELVWVDNAIDAFFLHIQGSGRVKLDDGAELRVGYAAQNGHPYVAIGKELVASGALTLESVSMQSIRAWLAAHPDQAGDIMRRNPSYVFFRKLEGGGPIGSQGVELEPYRSVAVDTAFVPLGSLMWIAGAWPSPRAGEPDRSLQRLVVAQDTGGAIRGPLRADLFCGHGEEASEIAGRLKHPFHGWLLLPRSVEAPR
jgi:membrane-bound lytic murein transglycosylase A